MRRVCPPDSSIVSSKQRVAFSWLTALAVVASMKAARASTVKTFRPQVPGLRVLDRSGGDELLPALQDADRVVGFHGAVAFLDDHELLIEEAGSGVVEALRREAREKDDVLGLASGVSITSVMPLLPAPLWLRITAESGSASLRETATK